jgi:hypothetical protein
MAGQQKATVPEGRRKEVIEAGQKVMEKGAFQGIPTANHDSVMVRPGLVKEIWSRWEEPRKYTQEKTCS